MMLDYPVQLEDDEGSILVTTPDFPELTTFGEDEGDALRHAVDALEEAIAARIHDARDIPAPSPGGLRVALPTLTVVKVTLYQLMRNQGIGKAELARRLDWHMPQVDRVLDLRHHSRMAQMDTALGAVGARLRVSPRRGSKQVNVIVSRPFEPPMSAESNRGGKEIMSGFVCAECISDTGIEDFIRENAVEEHCSYCSNSSNVPIAADLDDVVEYMYNCLQREFDDAANQLPYESAEGGYIGRHWDTYDLLFDHLELDLPSDYDGDLAVDLCRGIGDQAWCEARGINAGDRIQFSWESFSHMVKNHRRYFFLGSEQDWDSGETYKPQEMLTALFDNAQYVDLLRELPSGAQLFRARWEDPKAKLETAQELGPPPPDKAMQSNRMSPPGIVMFYACDDKETALLETAIAPGRFAVGEFRTLRNLRILDLSAIPPIPSIFESISDAVEFQPRDVTTFLHYVARQMSKPIERDGKAHIEYIPTQIVTEYIRSHLTWDGTRVDGVRYRSSVNPGHVSYVLFATQENLRSTDATLSLSDRWLQLVGISHESVALKVGK